MWTKFCYLLYCAMRCCFGYLSGVARHLCSVAQNFVQSLLHCMQIFIEIKLAKNVLSVRMFVFKRWGQTSKQIDGCLLLQLRFWLWPVWLLNSFQYLAKMYPQSSQKKFWSFKTEQELQERRLLQNYNFIARHGAAMSVSICNKKNTFCV